MKRSELTRISKDAELSASEIEAVSGGGVSGGTDLFSNSLISNPGIVVCQPSLLGCNPLGPCQGLSCPGGLSCPDLSPQCPGGLACADTFGGGGFRLNPSGGLGGFF